MTAEGQQGWLGPQTSCSSLPNTQSQMPSLFPEHLLPKAASVLLTPRHLDLEEQIPQQTAWKPGQEALLMAQSPEQAQCLTGAPSQI